MPATRRLYVNRIIRFGEGWRAGEYGRQNPSKAPPDSFTGLNVERYSTGLLGPRAGLKLMTTTFDTPTNGPIRGWGYNIALTVSADAFFAVIGNKVYTGGFTGSSMSFHICSGGAALPTASGQVFAVFQGAFTYFIASGKLYKLDHFARTYALVAGAPTNLGTLAQFGQVLVAGNDGSAGSLIRYSAALDPDTWPAGNFFQVGAANTNINALMNQRDHVVIAMTDGRMFVLRGTLAQTGALANNSTATLRDILQAFGVIAPDSWALLGDGNIAFCRSSEADTPSLGIITGSRVRFFEELPFGDRITNIGLTSRYGTVAIANPSDWFALGIPDGAPASTFAGKYALRAHNAWSFGTFTPASAAGSVRLPTVPGGASATIVLADNPGGGALTKVYSFKPYLIRPAFTSDTDRAPGDDSTTPVSASFTTSEWISDMGLEVGVLSVVVDFNAWNTGGTGGCHFDLQVETTRPVGEGVVSATQLSATQTYDNPSASDGDTSDAGVAHSIRFDFSDCAWGRGFRVVFSNLKGVAIENIWVHTTQQPDRG